MSCRRPPRGPPFGAGAEAPWITGVDWDHVRQEVGRGCTIKQIHREVAAQVPHLAFWRAFRDQAPLSPEVTIIGVIKRGFFREVRNRTFYSLFDLNHAFREYLLRLNACVMKDYGVSRIQRFEEEKRFLKSLPLSRFEFSEWRNAKVHPDCHIQVDKNFYSTPFRYVGQRVRIRLTGKMVEVFSEENEPVAAHTRLQGDHKFSTLDSHPVNFFFEEIAASRASGKYLVYLKTLIKTECLILDDFGLRNYTHEEATSLMDLLEERYQKGVVILTSQVNPEGWIKLFEDPVIAEAIVDRLIHPSQKIILKGGGSYRERIQGKKEGAKEGS